MTSAPALATAGMTAVPAEGWLPPAGSVLIVTDRPGQESTDLGGVLYAFRQAGARLSLLCLTRGEASPLNSTQSAQLESVRPWELQLAASVLGISSVTVASFPDGELHLRPREELSTRIRHAIRRSSADLVLVTAPEAGGSGAAAAAAYAAAAAACAAARQAGVPVVARTARGSPRTWAIDLGSAAHTARAIQRSAAAAHRSQSEALPGLIRRLDMAGPRELLRWLVRPRLASPADRALLDGSQPWPAATAAT
jgi:N-acetylglucosamine malate deacetylase 2